MSRRRPGGQDAFCSGSCVTALRAFGAQCQASGGGQLAGLLSSIEARSKPPARLSFRRHPLAIRIETPAGGRGGCSRMTVSLTARRGACRPRSTASSSTALVRRAALFLPSVCCNRQKNKKLPAFYLPSPLPLSLLPAGWRMAPGQNRCCHSADSPSPVLLKRLLKEEGGAAEPGRRGGDGGSRTAAEK